MDNVQKTNNGIQEQLETVFSVRSAPRLCNEDQQQSRESQSVDGETLKSTRVVRQ
jgi:hypothetical protein